VCVLFFNIFCIFYSYFTFILSPFLSAKIKKAGHSRPVHRRIMCELDTRVDENSDNAVASTVQAMETIETVVQTADPRAHMSENAVRILLSLAPEFGGAFMFLEITEEDFFEIFEEENPDTNEDAEDFRVFEGSMG